MHPTIDEADQLIRPAELSIYPVLRLVLQQATGLSCGPSFITCSAPQRTHHQAGHLKNAEGEHLRSRRSRPQFSRTLVAFRQTLGFTGSAATAEIEEHAHTELLRGIRCMEAA